MAVRLLRLLRFVAAMLLAFRESNQIKPNQTSASNGLGYDSPSPCLLPQERVSFGAALGLADEVAGSANQTQSKPVKPSQAGEGGWSAKRANLIDLLMIWDLPNRCNFNIRSLQCLYMFGVARSKEGAAYLLTSCA